MKPYLLLHETHKACYKTRSFGEYYWQNLTSLHVSQIEKRKALVNLQLVWAVEYSSNATPTNNFGRNKAMVEVSGCCTESKQKERANHATEPPVGIAQFWVCICIYLHASVRASACMLQFHAAPDNYNGRREASADAIK